MADKSDLEALARQYLDLWQDQLAGMAKEPEVTEMMARTVELMNANMAAFTMFSQSMLNEASQKMGVSSGATSAAENRDTREDASRSASAAPASRNSDIDVTDLLRRLEELEKRINSLEGRTQKQRRSPRKTTRKRRS